jgi:uncharacterized protein YlxW (UPF0749 family)
MKGVYKILVFTFSILFLISCGGPKKDTKKMLKYVKEYTEVAEKAIKDRVITDKEAEKLNEIKSKIEKYSAKLDNKYSEDVEAQKVIQEVLNLDENRKIMLNYTEILMRLWNIEGNEKLN